MKRALVFTLLKSLCFSRIWVPAGGLRGSRIGTFAGHHAESRGAVDTHARLSRLRGSAAGLLMIKKDLEGHTAPCLNHGMRKLSYLMRPEDMESWYTLIHRSKQVLLLLTIIIILAHRPVIGTLYKITSTVVLAQLNNCPLCHYNIRIFFISYLFFLVIVK